MKFEFDIKKVDLVTLGGVDLRKTFKEKMKKNFEQFLGETIYNSTRDVELDDKCKAIHRGEKVEFNEREKELFERAVKAIEFEPGLIERKIREYEKQIVDFKTNERSDTLHMCRMSTIRASFYSPFKSSSSRRTVIFIGFPSLTISSFLVRLSLILTALSNDKSFRVNPFIATISSPFCKPASL